MPELHVSKKTISKLLSEMQNRKFIIPDFQRPYKWDTEKCETLWNDIVTFTLTDARQAGNDYFLGTIVSYLNADKDLEIIDGQQRITSFFLVLRAFYKKLEDMREDDDVVGLKNQLAPCIWDINPISQKVSDKSKIHINSLVATEDDNEVFHKILETGVCSDDATDTYSVNFRYFKEQCDKYAEKNPLQWKELCVTILQKCIILPIECDTPETALTIFSTLNDRGLPLEDSDIFKAKIYKNIDENERGEFNRTWKELTQICKKADVTPDVIFRYYSHVLRARNNDKSKEVGLRRFYAENNYVKLQEPLLITEITALANFWLYLNKGIEPSTEDGYTLSTEARKYIHCLNCYPNEYWKYATSVFFLKNVSSNSFDENFCKMLKKLISFLFAKFIDEPTVNAIKDDIYMACISLNFDNKLQFKFDVDEKYYTNKISELGNSKISRALLLLDAYLHTCQNTLIPPTFDIEHIFPRKWLTANYNGWNIDDARLYLDRFGNKIVFEKKLNIQAGNGYFGNKKQKYSESKIASIIELSNYQNNDWLKEDIELREEAFKSNLIKFFQTHIN